MGKIISTEYVKNYFKEHGCQLLEEYVSAHGKLKYKCKCGNITDTTWNNFRNGHRCFNCYGKTRITYDFLVEQFRKQNCKLLETTYKDNATPMEYVCSCGKVSKTSWSNFKKGVRCRECGIKKYSGENHPQWKFDREKLRRDELLKKKYYCALRRTLKYIGSKKNSKSSILLGFTVVELQQHLEKFPNWNKLKNTEWALDHIFPIVAFLEHGIYDPKIINCLDNLQPLSKLENLCKHDKYDKEEFKKWLAKL